MVEDLKYPPEISSEIRQSASDRWKFSASPSGPSDVNPPGCVRRLELRSVGLAIWCAISTKSQTGFRSRRGLGERFDGESSRDRIGLHDAGICRDRSYLRPRNCALRKHFRRRNFTCAWCLRRRKSRLRCRSNRRSTEDGSLRFREDFWASKDAKNASRQRVVPFSKMDPRLTPDAASSAHFGPAFQHRIELANVLGQRVAQGSQLKPRRAVQTVPGRLDKP